MSPQVLPHEVLSESKTKKSLFDGFGELHVTEAIQAQGGTALGSCKCSHTSSPLYIYPMQLKGMQEHQNNICRVKSDSYQNSHKHLAFEIINIYI